MRRGGQGLNTEFTVKANLEPLLLEFKEAMEEMRVMMAQGLDFSKAEQQIRDLLGVMKQFTDHSEKAFAATNREINKVQINVEKIRKSAVDLASEALKKAGVAQASIDIAVNRAFGAFETSSGKKESKAALKAINAELAHEKQLVEALQQAWNKLNGYEETTANGTKKRIQGQREQLKGLLGELSRFFDVLTKAQTVATQSSQTLDAALLSNARSFDLLATGSTRYSTELTRNLRTAVQTARQEFKVLIKAAEEGSEGAERAARRVLRRLRKLSAESQAELLGGGITNTQAATGGRVLSQAEEFTGEAQSRALLRRIREARERKSAEAWRQAKQTLVWDEISSVDTKFAEARRAGANQEWDAVNIAALQKELKDLKQRKTFLDREIGELQSKTGGTRRQQANRDYKIQQAQILSTGVGSRIGTLGDSLSHLVRAREGYFAKQTVGGIDESYQAGRYGVKGLLAQRRIMGDDDVALGDHFSKMKAAHADLAQYIANTEARLTDRKIKLSAEERMALKASLEKAQAMHRANNLEILQLETQAAKVREQIAKDAERKITATTKQEVEKRKAEYRSQQKALVMQHLNAPKSLAGLDAQGLANLRAAINETRQKVGGLHDLPDGVTMGSLDLLSKQVRNQERVRGLNAPSRWAQWVNRATGLRMGRGNWEAYGGQNRSLFHRASHRITNVAQMMGTSLYGMGAFGAVTAITKGTIGLASRIQAAQMAMAGMVHSYAQFVDLQGRSLTPADQLNKSLEYSKVLYNDIRETAAKSLVTISELQEGFLTGAPQLMSKGFTDRQALTLTNQVLMLGKLQGLTSTAIMSDLRDFATGNINVRSQVLRSAGLKKEGLQAAYKEGGSQAAYEYFQKQMKRFQDVFKNIQNTPMGILNRFSVELQKLGQTFGETLIPVILPELVKFQNMLKNWTETGAMKKFAQSFGDMVGGIMETGTKLLNFLAPFVSNMSNLLLVGIAGVLATFVAKMAIKRALLGPPIVGVLAALGSLVLGIVAMKQRAESEAYGNLKALSSPYGELEKGQASTRAIGYLETQMREKGIITPPTQLSEWESKGGPYKAISPLMRMYEETGWSKSTGQGFMDLRSMVDFLGPIAFNGRILQQYVDMYKSTGSLKGANESTSLPAGAVEPLVKWLVQNNVPVSDFVNQVNTLKSIYDTSGNPTVVTPLISGRKYSEGGYRDKASKAAEIQRDVAKKMYADLKKQGKAPALKRIALAGGFDDDYVGALLGSSYADAFKERSADEFRKWAYGIQFNKVVPPETKTGTPVTSGRIGPAQTPYEEAARAWAVYQSAILQGRVSGMPLTAPGATGLGVQMFKSNAEGALASWRQGIYDAREKGPFAFAKVNIEFQQKMFEATQALVEHSKKVKEATTIREQEIEISKQQLEIDKQSLELKKAEADFADLNLQTAGGREAAWAKAQEIYQMRLGLNAKNAGLATLQQITNPKAIEAIRNASSSEALGWLNDATLSKLMSGDLSGLSVGDTAGLAMMIAAGYTDQGKVGEAWKAIKLGAMQQAINQSAAAKGKPAGTASLPASINPGAMSAVISGARQSAIRSWGQAFTNAFPGTRFEQYGSGSTKESLHPDGLALDLRGPNLPAYLQYAKEHGAKYIIYNRMQYRRQADGSYKSSPYTGPNPHLDHVHVDWGGGGAKSTAAGAGGEDYDPKAMAAISGMLPTLLGIPQIGGFGTPEADSRMASLDAAIKFTESAGAFDATQGLKAMRSQIAAATGQEAQNRRQFAVNQQLSMLGLGPGEAKDQASINAAADALFKAEIIAAGKYQDMMIAAGKGPEALAQFGAGMGISFAPGTSAETMITSLVDVIFSPVTQAQIAQKWTEIAVAFDRQARQAAAQEALAKESYAQEQWARGFDSRWGGYVSGNAGNLGLNPYTTWQDNMGRQRDVLVASVNRKWDSIEARDRQAKAPDGSGRSLYEYNTDPVTGDPAYYLKQRNADLQSGQNALLQGVNPQQIMRMQASQAFNNTAYGLVGAFMSDPYGILTGKSRMDWGSMSTLTDWAKQTNETLGMGMLFKSFGKYTQEQLQSDPALQRYLKTNADGTLGLDRWKMTKEALGNVAGQFVGQFGGQWLGSALFPGKDPAVISMGASLGTAAGGAGLLAGLGIAAGPWGAIAGGLIGGLLGGLFGGSKPDPEEQRRRELEKQHQKRMEELLSRIDKSLRPQADYFRTIKGEVLFGTASRWYSGRAYAQLGLQGALSGR